MAITKDMFIGQLLKEKPEAAEILFQYGMGCIGCPSAQMESLEQAAAVHGIDLEELLKSLNEG
jgi:hybrid cluster-associated redox disulfide protein